MQRILIIEDEPQLARLLQLELQFENFEADIETDGRAGLTRFQTDPYDLVLLDVMLPEMNGFEVLTHIRKTNQATPVILLTAKDDVKDKVEGLTIGANDYVTKPFQFEELLARIKVNLRFSQNNTASQQENHLELQQGNITVDLNSHEVKQDGQLIELTPREFDLLVHFLKNKNNVQNREQILNAVWGFDYFGDTNVVDVYVRYLRQKLGNTIVHTVRGVGYVLKEENS